MQSRSAWRGASLVGLALFAGCTGETGTPSGPAGPDGPDGPIDSQTQCLSDREFFVRELWPQVLGSNCVSCHSPGGIAAEQAARLYLLPDTYPGFVDQNLASLDEMIRTAYEDTPLLVAKPAGVVDHGGGVQLQEGSAEFELLNDWASRRLDGDPCPKPTKVAEFDGVELLDAQATFRKAALHLAGRLPRVSEIEQIDAEGEAALAGLLDGLTREPGFYTRLKELFNDLLLTDRYYPNTRAVDLLNRSQYAQAGDWFGAQERDVRESINRALAREPLELIAYIVAQDLPFTEVLTAPYTVNNPQLAQLYNTAPAFDDPSDEGEWQRAEVVVVADEAFSTLPHAGVLTTPVFLNRFPSSPTNLNRHRARMVMNLFLATDILRVAERPIDPAESTQYNNPTRDDPSCAGCHRQLDPLAGAFMSWDDRDQEELLPAREWPGDMFPPGFGTEVMPVSEFATSERWMAERIVADPRFGLSIVQIIYRAITGHEPILFPNAQDEADPEGALLAWEAQDATFRAVRQAFVDSGHDLRVVVTELVLSPYFRGAGVTADSTQSDSALRDVGTGRLSTPEMLDRRIQATTGARWQRGNGESNLLSEYLVLYGGIDSDLVIDRLTDANGVIAGVQWRMANELSCAAGPSDFQRPQGERRLFPHVTVQDTPRDDAGQQDDAAITRIRANIQHLHERLLGETLADDSAELDRTYTLFEQTWEEGVAGLAVDTLSNRLPYACQVRDDENGDSLPDDQRLELDERYAVRAWMAVLTYLFADYRFLYE